MSDCPHSDDKQQRWDLLFFFFIFFQPRYPTGPPVRSRQTQYYFHVAQKQLIFCPPLLPWQAASLTLSCLAGPRWFEISVFSKIEIFFPVITRGNSSSSAEVKAHYWPRKRKTTTTATYFRFCCCCFCLFFYFYFLFLSLILLLLLFGGGGGFICLFCFVFVFNCSQP